MKEQTQHRASLLSASPASIVALVLTAMAAFSIADWSTLRRHDGIDFWQFWGITKARVASVEDIGSPYLHADRYQQALEQIPTQHEDPALANAIHFRKQPDLTGSPLLYAAFAPMPWNYRAALNLYRTIQVLAFVIAASLLFSFARIGTTWVRAWLVLALLASSDPLMYDLTTGNVNALQLLAITVALRLGLRLRQIGNLPEAALAAACGALLTALVLLKPNVGIALLALGLSVLARSAQPGRVLAVVSCVMTALAALLLTSHLFGSWTVWLDWWQQTFRSVGRLSYPLETGNQSMSLYLATHLRVATPMLVETLAGLWIAALLAALAWPLRGQPAWSRPFSVRCLELLRDPGCGLAIGIVTMYLLSPLSWPHYYVLALLPVCWLLRDQRPWSAPAVMAWLALLLMSGLARRLYVISGGFQDDWMFAARVFAWLPLLPAILLRLAARRAESSNS